MKSITTRCKTKMALVLFGLALSTVVVVHEGQPHDPEAAEEKANALPDPVLQEVVEEYERSIRPIFQVKCFDCHSDQAHYPWYYRLPFAKGLIDSDIREAHKHIDMSPGFPFKGHGTPSKDLEAIANAINKGTMPPLRYVLMHWNARLTEEDKKAILQWAEDGQDKLFLRSN